MNINVWSGFSKRINSTKQPTGGTQKTVYLKEETDIESPTFILDSLDFTINYVEAFGHYYFAHCRNLDGHRTEIICDIDLMATYKSNIQSYSGLVEYTSSSSRIDITDPRNRPTCENLWASTDLLWGDNPFSMAGCYVVSIIGKKNSGYLGFVNAYVCDATAMATLLDDLCDQSILSNITQQMGGAMDSVVSCIWLPILKTKLSTQTQSLVYAGGEPIPNLDGHLLTLTGRILTRTITIDYVNFPTGCNGYLRKSPYCTGVLYLPFVGFVPLDMDIYGDYNAISIEMNVDVVTGDISYLIYGGGDYSGTDVAKSIASYSGNCGTKCPVSGASYDGVGVASGILTAIGGTVATIATAATGGAAGAVIKAAGVAAGGAALAFKSAEFHSMIQGGTSSAIGGMLGLAPRCYVCVQKPAETNLTAYQAEQGMPYFKTATLSSLSGYIKCANASVDCAADEAEKQTINGYMNSGFYLE